MKLMKDVNVHLENKRESRFFFVFLLIMYAVVYMTKNCFSGALAAIVAEGSLTLTQTSLISASFYIAYTPLQVLGGALADKYSPERLITIGLVGSALSNIVIFFNQNYYVMLASWVFSAIIQFALWPALFKIISSQLVRSDRPRMAFFISFGSSIGLIMSYVVSAFIPNWRYNFAISAVSLLLAALLLQLYCRHLDPILKRDYEPEVVEDRSYEGVTEKKYSTMKLFWISGFMMLLPVVLIRTMLENGSKTLSPTMLMQSYESISPAVGNLLNIFIIISGILGMILVKFVLYPRLIKNEITGYMIMLIAAVPFTVILRFVGEVPVWLIVLSLCMISMLLTSTHLFTQFFNLNFIKFGKNGLAAGVLNAAASLGLVLQYCVFGSVADNFGWNVVTALWVIMISVAIVCVAFAVVPAKKFKQSVNK